MTLCRPTVASAGFTLAVAFLAMFMLMVFPAVAGDIPGIDPDVLSQQSRELWERGFGPFLIVVCGIQLWIIISLNREARRDRERMDTRHDVQTTAILGMARESTAALVTATAQAAKTDEALHELSRQLDMRRVMHKEG